MAVSGSTANQVQQAVDRYAEKRPIRGVLAAVQSLDGAVDVSATAGFADAALQVPLRPDTPYFLASITKTYTAAVVMQLARDDGLDLAAPIGTYLDRELVDGLHVIEGDDHGPKLTVEHLLFQTSGLADYFTGHVKGQRSLEAQLNAGDDRAVTISDVVAIVRTLPPKSAPTSDRAHYSDTNYALLGAIIEAVSGVAIAKAFEDLIFVPLGLEQTFLYDYSSPRPKPAVMWHEDNPLEIPLAMSSFSADGAMVATLNDSLKMIRALFTGELLTGDELAYLTRRWRRAFFPIRYGGGLMQFNLSRWLSPIKNPGELVGHSGSTGSFAFFSPARELLLAGTVNQSDSPGRPFRLMSEIVNVVS